MAAQVCFAYEVPARLLRTQPGCDAVIKRDAAARLERAGYRIDFSTRNCVENQLVVRYEFFCTPLQVDFASVAAFRYLSLRYGIYLNGPTGVSGVTPSITRRISLGGV